MSWLGQHGSSPAFASFINHDKQTNKKIHSAQNGHISMQNLFQKNKKHISKEMLKLIRVTMVTTYTACVYHSQETDWNI